ncbi:MAG: ATPase [Deltaproteobacteria bacterium CG2_30_63_29]|nr:MAG: ATPase [Deltaproteobacteria bacterium CG2_30_63_29]PJB45677.1 MAG: ATPase [Deltaproteobacteria bacterium CG_4_9_14_3_um_filter_63_12]
MLRSIVLHNFKSFHNGNALLGPLSLIVGTNASGKSNLREALRVLHGVGLGYSLADILGEKYGPGGVLQWRGIRGGAMEASYERCGRFAIGVILRTPSRRSFYYQLIVAVPIDGPPLVVGERLHTARSFIFDSNPKDDPLEQTGEHQLRVRYPRGGNNRKHGKPIAFASSRPVLSQLAESRHESADARNACESVLEVFRSMRFLDLDPDAMRQPSQPGQLILGDRGENLSSVLQGICVNPQHKATLLEWLRALTPMDAVDFDFKADHTGKVLVYLKESNGFEVSANSASDGTLRFLALVAALLSEDSGRIYFFEELDNGIHPTRLHLLLDLVQRASKNLNIQVIGTTHNPALLAFLDEQARNDALLVYRSETSEGSRLIPIMSLPRAKEILASQDLGRLHQAGWLEDAAIFSETDEFTEAEDGH